MPAQLLALNEGPSIFLDKPVLLLGRDLECDVRFNSSKVSRKHCCIAQVGDYLVVRDLGSTNGVRINGVAVVEGRLGAGDELTIGDQRYQVRWDEWAVASSRPAARDRRPQEGAGRPPDDEMLELCDDPVALSEAAGRPSNGGTAGPQAGGNSHVEPPADAGSEDLPVQLAHKDVSTIAPVHAREDFPDQPSSAASSP